MTPNKETSVPKIFESRIQVKQVSQDAPHWGMLLFAMAGAVPGSCLAVRFNRDAEGWQGVLSAAGVFFSIALIMIGVFTGLFVWYFIEKRWLACKGIIQFCVETMVRANSEGFNIEGLGMSTWRDVLNYEEIPDCSWAMIVQTRQYGRLLLHVAPEDLVPVLDQYVGMRDEPLRYADAS